MTIRWFVMGALLAAAPAAAEEPEEGADVAAEAVEGEDWAAALNLPLQAEKLRRRGVPDADVSAAVEAAKAKGLDPGATGELLEASGSAVAEHGAVEGFGDFVTSKIDEGLRGPELAEAIRAEHQARGLGKGTPAPGWKPRGKGKKAKGKRKAKMGKRKAKMGKRKAKVGKNKVKAGGEP